MDLELNCSGREFKERKGEEKKGEVKKENDILKLVNVEK